MMPQDKQNNNNNESHNESRTQYLIYLKPDDSARSNLRLIQERLRDTTLLNSYSDIPHMTILGFYSESKTLKMSSLEYLESRLVTLFEKFAKTIAVNNPIIEDVAITKYSHYGDRVVLNLESSYLNELHTKCVDSFKSFIVLKGGICAEKNAELFRERYMYSLENYHPHITLGKTSASDREIATIDTYIDAFLGKNISFDELILSKKEQNRWVLLSSLKL